MDVQEMEIPVTPPKDVPHTATSESAKDDARKSRPEKREKDRKKEKRNRVSSKDRKVETLRPNQTPKKKVLEMPISPLMSPVTISLGFEDHSGEERSREPVLRREKDALSASTDPEKVEIKYKRIRKESGD